MAGGNTAAHPPAHRDGWCLHLRARGSTATAVGWALAAVLTGAGGWWLASRPWFAGPAARPPVVALGPLLAVVLTSRTLAGDDVDLERSTARLSRAHRLRHASIVTVVPALVLAVTLLDDPAVYGAAAAIRNVFGLTGLTLLSCAFVSARLAWAPPTVLAATTYLAAAHETGTAVRWWGWLLQPGHLDPSWVVAVGFALTGVLVYSLVGPRSQHHE